MKCTCSFSYFSAPRPSSHLSSVAMVESSASLPVAPGHMPPSTRSLGFEEERQGAGDAGEAAVLTRGRRWCPAGGEGATAAGRRYGHRGREERRGRGWLGRGVGESWRKGRVTSEAFRVVQPIWRNAQVWHNHGICRSLEWVGSRSFGDLNTRTGSGNGTDPCRSAS